ncbi:MAG TPA: transposase [Crenotrichaceae bacterium]|nr:transposase [Crenotrichaceae bacterium]
MPEQGTAVKTSLFAAAEIDRIAPHPTSRQGDRPPYSTERMVRVLVLQQLYGISDEGLEYQLLDRLSFQRFCSLRDSSSIPDARTIWAFRERSYKAGGANVLFEAVQHQLQQYGFHACGGQIIDASLVKALIHHVRKNEKKSRKKAQIPSGWNTARQRQKNTDASWTKKQGKSQSDCQKRRNASLARARLDVCLLPLQRWVANWFVRLD